MKLVLLADVKGQGKKGQLIDVSDGYARNYLLPRKLAVEAGAQVLNEMKSKEEARKHQEAVDLENAQKLKEKIESTQLVIKAASGEGQKLYGAITSKDLAEKLAEAGIEVDKKKIVLNDPIKAYGNYTVDVKLHPTVVGKINLIVTQ
ncbi:MAG: 50S ribosomal protein L9 [Clostridiales bacterium]|nr:50S ribosomal protein L9 [Clostridiales bacterium]